MEGGEIQMKGCKFPRISSSRGGGCSKIGQKKGEEQHPDDEDDGEIKWGGGFGRFCGWPSSRIVRVSRATGGKDRHSKVLTTKGLRDRRVRLSVTTAIQFYDLQDRLGYDQPSKAVEWLLKAAAKSIEELPSINTLFPDTPKQPSDEKIGSSAEVELGGDSNHQQHQRPKPRVSSSKSACSSNSETSKGSGLSLSRSESRIKARKRAKERKAEKEKEKGCSPNVNSISPSSFTELLNCGLNNVNNSNNTNPNGSTQRNARHQWPFSAPPIDYIAPGLVAQNHHSSGFSGQIHLGNSLPQSMMMMNIDQHPELQHFSFIPDQHPELQHFSFIPDHLIQAASGGGDYNNLSFTIPSSLAGLNRGTLQSNSPSQQLPHLQRPSPIDGSNILPFFLGSAAPNAEPVEENHHHHHQFPAGLDGRLQLWQSDQKGKGKN